MQSADVTEPASFPRSRNREGTPTLLNAAYAVKSDDVDAVVDAAYPLDLLQSVLQQLFQIECGHTSANHQYVLRALKLKSVCSTSEVGVP